MERFDNFVSQKLRSIEPVQVLTDVFGSPNTRAIKTSKNVSASENSSNNNNVKHRSGKSKM